jgi:preprotein translocase subunit SecG
MKKSIMLLLMALLTNISIANTSKDTLKSTSIPDTSQVTFREVYTDMKAGLAGLAESLKVGSEHVYGVMVKQQYVKSITGILVFLLCIILAIISLKQSSKMYKSWREKTKGYDVMLESPIGIGSIVFGGVGLVCIILIMCIVFEMYNIVTGFVNPEYGALKDIMEFVKSK